MQKLIIWVRTHKLTSLLLLVVVYFIYKSLFGVNLMSGLSVTNSSNKGYYGSSLPTLGGAADLQGPSAVANLAPNSMSQVAQPSVARMVVSESNLSLLVTDVRVSGDQVISYAEKSGGYMVATSYSRPTESPFATITVRVPSAGLNDALKYFRSLGVKVTNENLVGTDVTDQYTDIASRLDTLNRTKVKFEKILDSAVTVQDTLTVEREIINLQSQIDALKGQQLALDQNARLTKITLYLSTDELALPYTPDNTFRPAVIFKLAVRSLVGTLRDIGEKVIWIAVYAVNLGPGISRIFYSPPHPQIKEELIQYLSF